MPGPDGGSNDVERAAAGLGRSVGRHGLHVDPELDRVAARCGLPDAGVVERRAAGEPQLRLHQVDARHFLGDGVLDLQARIGLDEAEEIRGRIVDQELEGAEAAIVHGRGHRHRRIRRSVGASARPDGDWAPARRSSGCGAGSCIRVRRGQRYRPARRRRSAPRYDARARSDARHRVRRCRRPPALRPRHARRRPRSRPPA